MEAAGSGGRQSDPVQVLIVDDSFLIREGLRQLLALSPLIEVVGAVGDGTEARAAVERHPPDVVLTDIRMPPDFADEGLALADALRRSHPQVGVVVLAQCLEPADATVLLHGGAAGRGFLLKDRVHDLDQLVDCLCAVAAGDCRIDPILIDRLVATEAARGSVVAVLTPRQREILADVAGGMSNQAIADTRHLSLRAVEKHVSEVFTRLGIAHDPRVSRRVIAALLFLDSAPR